MRDAAGYAAANAIDTFHRYYGDLNGNGTVDASDVDAARLALGSKLGQSSYRAELDLNGNKRIDAAEYAQVRSRLHRGPLFGPARTLPGSRGGYG